MSPQPHDVPRMRRTFSGPVTHTQVTENEYAVDHNFYYRDRNGLLWCEREGDISDGGSIPRFFWRLVGDPFSGPVGAYRIHDLICRLSVTGCDHYGMRSYELRRYADEIVFPDAMEDYASVVPGTAPGPVKRWFMVHLGVNIGRYKQYAIGRLKKDTHAEAQCQSSVHRHRDGSDACLSVANVEGKHTSGSNTEPRMDNVGCGKMGPRG